MSEPLLQARGVGRVFHEGGRALTVLDGVDFSLPRGACVAVLGRSGSGKSTLLHLLGGLDRPTHGQVFFNGTDLFAMNELAIDRYRNRDVGFVFQQYHLLPELSALENVRIASMIAPTHPRPRKLKQENSNGSKTSTKQRAADLLDRVGLGDRLRQPAQPALRRGTPARRHRPRAYERTRHPPRRRTHRQPRRRDRRLHPQALPRVPRPGTGHGPRHPRRKSRRPSRPRRHPHRRTIARENVGANAGLALTPRRPAINFVRFLEPRLPAEMVLVARRRVAQNHHLVVRLPDAPIKK